MQADTKTLPLFKSGYEEERLPQFQRGLLPKVTAKTPACTHNSWQRLATLGTPDTLKVRPYYFLAWHILK